MKTFLSALQYSVSSRGHKSKEQLPGTIDART
jgi:hypothetical protein